MRRPIDPRSLRSSSSAVDSYLPHGSRTVPKRKSSYRYSAQMLKKHWDRLHRGDREPWPEESLLARLGAKHAPFASRLASLGGAAAVALALQSAWGEFHAGDFRAAIEQGTNLGAIGAVVANKAAAVDSLYSKQRESVILQELDVGVKRGEQAVKLL